MCKEMVTLTTAILYFNIIFLSKRNIDLLRSIPSILFIVMTTDNLSVPSRPTESELDLELAELVNWQRFATHLPHLTRGDIEQIEQDNRDVQRQKLDLFGTWLRRCPNPSWSDIVLALEKSRENALASIIKMKFITSATEAHSQARLFSSPNVYLTSEKSVVEELQKLHRTFSSLSRDIRCKLDELVKSGKSSLHNIAAYIEELQVCGMKRLTAVKTIDELFGIIRPYNDYLDCELLEMIVEEYLDDEYITKLKAYINNVKLFKRTAPIKTLKDKLHQYTSIPNISDKHLIVTIKLQADWGRVTLESIEKLVQNLLDYRQTARIFKVESGSIIIMLLLPKEKCQHFIVSSSQKQQFMRLTGILRLQIGTTTVFEERENKNFSFKSALLESSQSGNDEAVQFLLDMGVDVDCSNSEGQTALILASKSGKEEVVQTLISAGANISHRDNNGHTALMVSNTNKIFLLLLQPNADINFLEHSTSTHLMIASDLGHVAISETLLVEYNNDPNVQNKAGWSALMFASRSGHLQVVKLLLKENADPNVQNLKGSTALIFASRNGYHKVVKILLKNGADPNIHAIDGLTALIIASINSHLQVVTLLLKACADPNICNEEGWTALIVASIKGHLQLTELLLKEKVDPNDCNDDGWTALMFASQNAHLQIGELLLKENADPNICNIDGWTALMFASQNGHLQLAELLLKKNANPNVHDNDGFTALMIGCQKGRLSITELLLKSKADSNAHDNEGWTPLMFASQNDHLKIVELLLKENADPNLRNNDGWTALMFACQNGCQHIAELLLKKNADPNVFSNTEWTPLLLASKNGHSNVVVMLLQHKANPSVGIRKHLDSFTIATVKGNTGIVNTFLNHSEIRFESLSMGWYYACHFGHVPIITLLSQRIDIISDQTDLIVSCAEGDLGTVIDQLMSGKITPDVQFIHGITPLMLSSSCGHTDIVETLIQSGANVNKTDEFGHTALDYAKQAKQDTTQVPLLEYDGLCGIELYSRVSALEEPYKL